MLELKATIILLVWFWTSSALPRWKSQPRGVIVGKEKKKENEALIIYER
jgi:hypothetical protein